MRAPPRHLGRRPLLAGGIAAAVAAATTSRAQAPAGPVRLGYLWSGAAGTDDLTLRGIRQGLADIGLVEGRNLELERRYAGGYGERLEPLAAELVRAGVAVLLTAGTAATRAARAATRSVPIVSVSGNPVAAGFAASLARPGGNVTGLSLLRGSELVEKWIELLKDVVPSLARAAVLYDAGTLPDLPEAARRGGSALGLDVVLAPAGDRDAIQAALVVIDRAAVGGFVVDGDPLFVSSRARIITFAAERRLPVVYGLRQFVEDGGLMSYGANITGLWRQAGSYVARILRGASPAELPIEQARSFELLVNLSAGRTIGIAFPPALLARADEVIE